MEYIATNLYKDKYVDVIDFIRQRCIDNKEELIIIHGNRRMTLSPKDVKRKAAMVSDKVYKNQKEGPETYKLVSYVWVPDELEY